MNVTYTFYLDNVGIPKLGATPVFETFIDIDGSITNMNAGGSVENVLATDYPEIKELTGGFYFFEFNWSTFTGNSYLVNINCGGETEFADPKQRFVIMKLERNDNLFNMVELIETSSNNIVNANASLLKSINRLLEIEQGTWKIEEEANQWYLNLYPTEDSGAPANPLYETTLNVGQPFAKYLLQDIDGLPTNVNAMRRIQSSITSLP
jgi:hypothetical protein